jgi:CRISPR-associated protein Csm5
MRDIIEREKTRITTVSPVHIGSVEQRLTPFEYCQYKHFVYPISEEKLAHFLQENNLIDSYINEVSMQGHQFRLLNYFRSKKINVSERELLSISNERAIRLLGDPNHLQDYRPLIRDGFGKPYIPGTSIKGVIRTAVLYNALVNFQSTNSDAFKKNIVEKIEKTDSSKFKRRSPFEWIQRELLECYQLSGKNGSPHSDWLRMLHVTDAYPVNLKETWLVPVNVLKKETTGWKYKTDKGEALTTIWVECLPSGTFVDFELGWDHGLLDNFQKENRDIALPKNIDELLIDIEKWSSDTSRFDTEFAENHNLENWYKKNNKLNFRIGFASGMVSTTMISLLPYDTRKLVRNSAGRNKGNDIAPKSRRVWIKDGQPIPLGWSHFQIEPFDKIIDTSNSEEMSKATSHDNPAQGELQIVEEISKQSVIPEKKPPEQILCKDVILLWTPGNRALTTTVKGKKAFVENIERSFVPESLWPKLEKKKSVKATIVVEPIGNAFKIIEVMDQ